MPSYSPVAPITRPSSSRCGHSTSIGATARNSGPGKSPLLPIADCAMASSVAISASRSERSVEEKGSTGTKSTVPAIVVFRPSVGKRVMVRMPDSPAVSFVQLSALPEPSDVTTPIPVTTTIGLPNLSRVAVISTPSSRWTGSADCFDQRHAFAPPMASPHHDNLGRGFGYFNLQPGGIVRRKQCAARDRKRSKRKPQRKLRLHCMAEHRSGGAYGVTRMLAEESPLLGRNWFSTGHACDQATIVAEYAKLGPKGFQRFCNLAGVLATRQIGDDVGQARIGFCAACLRMSFGLDDEKSAGRAERKACVFLARPNRRKLVLEVEAAELVEDQEVLAFAVLRATDQRDVALTAGDTCERDPRRVNACSFLAHESARRSGYAVHDGDVAGQQVRKLRQKKRRTQIVHQPFVEKPGRGIALRFGTENAYVDREIALATAGGDNHIHPPEDFLVALNAGRIQRQPRGISPNALPGFHLALIALFRDLRVKIYRDPGMNDVRREIVLIDVDASLIERIPVRIQPFAKRGRQTNAGDPDFRRRFRLSHGRSVLAETRCAWPWRPCIRADRNLGRGRDGT